MRPQQVICDYVHQGTSFPNIYGGVGEGPPHPHHYFTLSSKHPLYRLLIIPDFFLYRQRWKHTEQLRGIQEFGVIFLLFLSVGPGRVCVWLSCFMLACLLHGKGISVKARLIVFSCILNLPVLPVSFISVNVLYVINNHLENISISTFLWSFSSVDPLKNNKTYSGINWSKSIHDNGNTCPIVILAHPLPFHSFSEGQYNVTLLFILHLFQLHLQSLTFSPQVVFTQP